MNRILIWAVMGFLWVSSALLASDAQKEAEGMTVGDPLWISQASDFESVLFIQEEGKQLATGKLLFIPSEKFRITHPDRRMRYEEGKDYTWKTATCI